MATIETVASFLGTDAATLLGIYCPIGVFLVVLTVINVLNDRRAR